MASRPDLEPVSPPEWPLSRPGFAAADETGAGRVPAVAAALEALPIEEGQRVINLNLNAASSDADDRLIVSDGIITGDIVLQGLLKRGK